MLKQTPLSLKQYVLVFRALAMLWLVRIGLWLLPFGSIRRLIQEMISRIMPAMPASDVVPSEVAWSVNAAARLVPGSTCLVRALAVRILLARAGIPSLVYVGVRRTATGIDAHAWLECQEEMCMGARDRDTYAALSRDCF